MIALTVLLEIDIAIKVKIEASASMIAVIQIRSIPKLGKDICIFPNNGIPTNKVRKK